MKKIIKITSTFLVIAFCYVSLCMTVFASEVDSNENTFNWLVASNYDDETEKESTSESNVDKYIAKTNNLEADELWNNFVKSVSVLETDSKYEAILKLYETSKTSFARTYVEVYEDKTEEDFYNMTPFERFLWYTTYGRPLSATRSETYEIYFGSIDKWNSNVISSTYKFLKNQGATEQAEVYKKLMEWQYNYFIENGAMYNFMTGKSSIEENSIIKPVKRDATDKMDRDPTAEEIKEEFGDELQDLIEQEKNSTKNGKGNGSSTKTDNKSNVVIIVVILIAVVVIIGVVFYLKRKPSGNNKG